MWEVWKEWCTRKLQLAEYARRIIRRGAGRRKIARSTGLEVKKLTLLLSNYTDLIRSAPNTCINIYNYGLSNVNTCSAYPAGRSWTSHAVRLKCFVNYKTAEQTWEIMTQAAGMLWKHELCGGPGDGWLGRRLSEWQVSIWRTSSLRRERDILFSPWHLLCYLAQTGD